jgi:peptide/nickel transport system permease protein
VPTLLVVAAVQLGMMILMESPLSYLGLGVQRPSPTWVRMIGDGHTYVRDGLSVFTLPGVFIASVVLGVTLLGDGLRKMWKME